jgi:hypothetical protein
VRVTLFRRGKVWWVRHGTATGQLRRSLKTENRKVAEDLRCEVEMSLRRGTVVTVERAVPRAAKTVLEFLDEYEAYSRSRKRPKSHATDIGRLRTVFEFVGDRALDEVSTNDLLGFITTKTLKDGVAPATVLRYRESLSAFFQHARRVGYLSTNPATAIPRPRLPDRDVRYLRVEEIEKVLEVVRGDRIEPLGSRRWYDSAGATGRAEVAAVPRNGLPRSRARWA